MSRPDSRSSGRVASLRASGIRTLRASPAGGQREARPRPAGTRLTPVPDQPWAGCQAATQRSLVATAGTAAGGTRHRRPARSSKVLSWTAGRPSADEPRMRAIPARIARVDGTAGAASTTSPASTAGAIQTCSLTGAASRRGMRTRHRTWLRGSPARTGLARSSLALRRLDCPSGRRALPPQLPGRGLRVDRCGSGPRANPVVTRIRAVRTPARSPAAARSTYGSPQTGLRPPAAIRRRTISSERPGDQTRAPADCPGRDLVSPKQTLTRGWHGLRRVPPCEPRHTPARTLGRRASG